jgi:hypothetical protein
MAIKNNKVNLNEIHALCLRRPFDEFILLQVISFCQALQTIGMTELVTQGLTLCQNAMHD